MPNETWPPTAPGCVRVNPNLPISSLRGNSLAAIRPSKHRRRLRGHLYWTFTDVSVAASVTRNVHGISEIMVKMNSIMFPPLNGSKYSQDPKLAEDWTEKELAELEYA